MCIRDSVNLVGVHNHRDLHKEYRRQRQMCIRDSISGVRKALLCYRVMAYIVGTLLIVLVCVAMPLKYAAGRPTMVNVVGISHGWLYPVLLITAYLLGRKAGWPLTRLLIIALAGTIPFLSFVAEYFARKDVNRRIDDAKNYWAHHGAPTE